MIIVFWSLFISKSSFCSYSVLKFLLKYYYLCIDTNYSTLLILKWYCLVTLENYVVLLPSIFSCSQFSLLIQASWRGCNFTDTRIIKFCLSSLWFPFKSQSSNIWIWLWIIFGAVNRLNVLNFLLSSWAQVFVTAWLIFDERCISKVLKWKKKCKMQKLVILIWLYEFLCILQSPFFFL